MTKSENTKYSIRKGIKEIAKLNIPLEKRKHVLQWHITHKCNLRCKHCYQDNYSDELSYNELEKILHKYKEYITDNNFRGHINFTGGEPFLRENELFKLMETCDKLGITYGILTNGVLLDNNIVEKLKQLKNLKFIQLSLEGTRRVNDSIRGKGNYSKVLKTVKILNKANIETMISFTLHEKNYRELRKLIWICRIHRVKRFWTDRLVPIGGIKEQSNLKLITTEHFIRCMEILKQEQKLNKLGTRVHTNRAMQFFSGCGEFYECSAGKQLLTILADGTLLPCRRLPIKLGNIAEDTMRNIVNKNKDTINQIHTLADECKTCHMSKACNSGAKCLTYSATGQINKADINCPFYHLKAKRHGSKRIDKVGIVIGIIYTAILAVILVKLYNMKLSGKPISEIDILLEFGIFTIVFIIEQTRLWILNIKEHKEIFEKQS